jgi:hypothetical protein
MWNAWTAPPGARSSDYEPWSCEAHCARCGELAQDCHCDDEETMMADEDDRPLMARVARYLQLVDEPEFVECTRCKGDGYHHGFGEGGVDPDWCEECGGPGQYLHPDANVSPDDLLRKVFGILSACAVARRGECPDVLSEIEELPAEIESDKRYARSLAERANSRRGHRP